MRKPHSTHVARSNEVSYQLPGPQNVLDEQQLSLEPGKLEPPPHTGLDNKGRLKGETSVTGRARVGKGKARGLLGRGGKRLGVENAWESFRLAGQRVPPRT